MTHVVIGADGYATVAAWVATLPVFPAPLTDNYIVLVRQGLYPETITWDQNNNGNQVLIEGDSNMNAAAAHESGTPNDFPVFDQQGVRANSLHIINGGVTCEKLAFLDPTAQHVLDDLTHGPEATRLRNCSFENGVNVYESNEASYSMEFRGCYFLNHTGNGLEYYSFAAAPNDDIKLVQGCIFHYTDDTISPAFGIVQRVVTTDGSRGNVSGCLFLNETIPAQGLIIGVFGAGGLIENNQFIDMQEMGWRTGWVDTPWLLRDNFCDKTGNDMFVGFQAQHNTVVDFFRNTICNMDNYGIRLIAAAAGGTFRSWNNILCNNNIGHEVEAGVTLVNDFNCYFNNAFADLNGAGVYNDPEANWILADPLFDLTSHRGMALQAGSPCRDAGTPADGLPHVKESDAAVALVDMGCQQYLPANLQQNTAGYSRFRKDSVKDEKRKI